MRYVRWRTQMSRKRLRGGFCNKENGGWVRGGWGKGKGRGATVEMAYAVNQNFDFCLLSQSQGYKVDYSGLSAAECSVWRLPEFLLLKKYFRR